MERRKKRDIFSTLAKSCIMPGDVFEEKEIDVLEVKTETHSLMSGI